MEELKTLKDFRFDKDGRGGIDYCEDGDYIFPETIKEEAIEMIKEDMDRLGLIGSSFESLLLLQRRIMKWINFFNITEEDLK